MLKVIFDHSVLRVPFLLASAAAVVVAIAGGYITIYKIVTFVGN
jgi:hypothetical protein